MYTRICGCWSLLSLSLGCAWSFPVDTSEQPDTHPPLSPPDGEVAITNPPSLIWRADSQAVAYTVEFCRVETFGRDVIRVDGVDMPFYNHSAPLANGTWHWRYFVLDRDGHRSEPGPVRSFVVTPESVLLPVPPTPQILASMPAHPRIYVTPDALEEFRARRTGAAREAWRHLRHRADGYLRAAERKLDLQPMPENPGSARKQVFYVKDGTPFVPKGYRSRELNADAGRANVLSFAYLISGDTTYAEAAKKWLLFVAPFRMDYHLEDRGQHDTVVYNYEYGLKGVALAFDRLYEHLSESERRQVLDHIDYHGDNAYRWCRTRLKLHLNYQNSHGQQCMHALLTTALAVATDSLRAAEWCDWLIRQYVNRIAWGGNDGGYSEGQTYGHKFQFILDGLLALDSATGIDVFKKARMRNSGDFWLYCMSLNYWWNHWGDVYSLLYPMVGNSADGYIAGLLAHKTGNRALKWYSDTVVCNPAHMPFRYTSSTDLKPKPPIDIAQARLFPEVGQIAAYDRFYDHRSSRIFFRSSPWGSHSHAHADQNGFVLHAGGEIMACDAGYYTYCGDTYHRQWSVSTKAHNSILVNGEGQPKSIDSKGEVTAFFNTPTHCLFTGSAAAAYPEQLGAFDRTVLFIRPGVFVVHDELVAQEPSVFSWVLNAFQEVQVDESKATLVVRQQEERLRVQHLAPQNLTYSQSNDRPFPLKTKRFCRVTEAFPQHHHVRVTTTEKRKNERILAVMDAFQEQSGPVLSDLERLETDDILGVRFRAADGIETVLFRSQAAEKSSPVSLAGIESDARVTSIRCRDDGHTDQWFLQAGSRLIVDGGALFSADSACDAALVPGPGGGQIWITNGVAVKARFRLAQRPSTLFIAPPNCPDQAKPLSFVWNDGFLEVALSEAGEHVCWIDPVMDLTRPPKPLELTVTDGVGSYVLELETAVADNGELIAFAELDPREPGLYTISAGEAELLIQNRWDPVLNARGKSSVAGLFREATEVLIRYAPTSSVEARAELKESLRGRIVNLLRNGDFERGVPSWPPRGWTISHPRTGDLGWPGWSQESPAEGASCLRFFRPKDRISARSQPMRLRKEAKYILRFKARGTATHAKVAVSGQLGTSAKVEVAPSEAWREYQTELNGHPGYCIVSVDFKAGGDPDQILWVDDMEFGYIVP
ncbi:MAG: DUF4962 domain-containing protein [Lentisphaerae bacterium]|nr:DUF4962 domain-containing protein [Lentisphaerota bacterium]MBT5612163.1 DUF4962 domain-containing protein [Lentisphaerota bacterium]MBT7061090.1 DUF4962 domain-containing protein [Lentisphaerota bacterium]MBT7843419.1 DUF4962 domain-containing protein [Lentisphaerota bacterium]